MSLDEALKRRGWQFRQHLDEVNWGKRKPTVVDLDDEQQAALDRSGVAGLKAVMDRIHAWTFPALDIAAPLPRRADLVLSRTGRRCAAVVVPEADAGLAQLGRALVAAVKQRHGVELPLLTDAQAGADLLATRHLIFVGGSHENRLAMKLALRFQTFFVDASVPGHDGWVVTTHAGVHVSGHNIAQLTATPAHHAPTLACLLDRVTADADGLRLQYVHHIQPGALLAGHLPSWETFAAGLAKQMRRVEIQDAQTLNGQTDGEQAPTDPVALAEVLAAGLDSGGPERNLYNAAPVDIAILSARYYQLSGDPRALQLFRELLIRLADYYLQLPGGASYPSDLDFRLGHLILCYARLEHASVFDDDDRLILVNLLLACARSVHEYASKIWPVTLGATRHNHQTFPALSLLYATDYFSRFNLAEVEAWRRYCDAVFDSPLWHRAKQRENANAYEGYVPEHAVAYAAFIGQDLERFADGCLKQVVERQIMTTDNFFRRVDYGDSGLSMQPADPVLARLLATQENGVVRWFAAEGFNRRPDFLPRRVTDFPGIRLESSPPPPGARDWQYQSLDPAFLEEYHPGYPQSLAFDKLAFRTGWTDADHYLLLEGVTGAVSHAHRETNSIVRLNHLGRHWIVSNGYGKRVGMTNITKAFSSRVRGPEDHNMLVLERAGEIVRTTPPAALVQRGQRDELLYATSLLGGYGGVNWFRTLIVMANTYLLVIDRVCVTEAGLEKAHIEWNALGDVTAQPHGIRLHQQGVFMDIASAGGWNLEQDVADRSSCWKSVLDSGEYPYAGFPLTKLIFHMPTVAKDQSHCLATLFAATRTEDVPYAIQQPEPGRVIIEGPQPITRGRTFVDDDLHIQIDTGRCEVGLAMTPAVPVNLQAWLVKQA